MMRPIREWWELARNHALPSGIPLAVVYVGRPDVEIEGLRFTNSEEGMSEMGKPEVATTCDDVLRFFAYTHLSGHLQAISRPFADLASKIVQSLPDNAEREMALRKLLEAKDCAVRARL